MRRAIHLQPVLATVVFALALVPRADAQSQLAIGRLSTTPRLLDHGEAYDIQVRFTTTAPAMAGVHFGTDASCADGSEQTEVKARNHRFDIRAVPAGEKRFVRVSARTPDGEETSSEPVAIEPPPPFPEGSQTALRIPLTVVETEGLNRTEPVTFAIPLPPGALGSPWTARLESGAPIQITTRPLVRWPDRTIKWLLVNATVTVGAAQTRKLELIVDPKISPSFLSTFGSMITQSDEKITVETGLARLLVDRATGAGGIYQLDLEEGYQLLSTLPVSRLVATDGSVYTGKVERVCIEEDNSPRTIIAVSGHHRNAQGEPFFGFTLRYICHHSDPYITIEHVIEHDMARPDDKYGDEMRSFAALDLVFEPAQQGERAQVSVLGDAPVEIADGQRLFQHSDGKFVLDGKEGGRCAGLITDGRLAVAVADFWQQWPKGLGVSEGKVEVGLFPAITPRNRYAKLPNEDIHYFYIRDGHYTFRAGFEKRHRLLLGPTPAAGVDTMLARVNAPLLVTAHPTWYAATGALFDIAANDSAKSALYDQALDKAVDGYFQTREDNHWYGLMNYGDTVGGRAHSWKNIEYDAAHGFLTQYVRTGDRRFFLAGEQAARHNADIDVVHYAAGQRAGPGVKREVGQAWVHCMGHTGGYYPPDHLGMGLYAQGYAENRGHMWNQGNLTYYLLTGDRQVQRSAMQVADWVAGSNTTNFSYGNARVPGWMGIIAMSTYFATYDDYYLNAMRLMYEEVQARADAKHGLWIHTLSGGHCRCEEKHVGEAGFMAGVLMTALKYFYLATRDEEVAQRIVAIANYLVDVQWRPEDGAFRYTSCPNTHTSPILNLIILNGLSFAANHSDDERLMRVAWYALANGLVALKAGPAGAGGGLLELAMCSTPLAIAEISRFPPRVTDQLPPLEKFVNAKYSPAARPYPSLVPNPSFEEDIQGWTVRPSLELSRSTAVAHSGRASAMASGNIEGQNEYFVTRYACGPPWETTWLERGKAYRLQLWLRVDRLAENAPPPRPRVSMRSRGQTRDTFYTTPYDTSRMGTWQMLQTDFTVPDYYDALYLAVSTDSKAAQQNVLMYLDDVAIVPTETPRRDTYEYAACSASDATLTGELELRLDPVHTQWRGVTSTQGRPGAATFAVDITRAETFRLLVRAKAPTADARLELSVDSKHVGTLQLQKSDSYQWHAVTAPDGQATQLRLGGGQHAVTITFLPDQQALVQKVCLVSELTP